MTSASATSAGGNHHRQLLQKDAGRETSGVFVVRGWLNELSLDRGFRPLHHFYAITLRIVLNFVHDVVDKEDAAARSAKQIRGVARIGNLADVETFAFVFDGKTRFFRRQLGSNPEQFARIVLVAVFYGVHKGLVERDEQVRTIGLDQTQLRDALLQVLEHAVHQTEITRQFKFDLLVNVRQKFRILEVTQLVGECFLDDFAELVAVVRQAKIVRRAHFEGFYRS